jgi:cation diffusion facilitator family transporter
MSDCDCDVDLNPRSEKNTLVTLLTINGVMFLFEFVAGLFADSSALLADSLDMLADATVYAIALYAVGRSLSVKVKAAMLSGLFQLTLGIGLLIEIIRRVIWGSEPVSMTMIVVGILALIANVVCLVLIAKHRRGEIHMRASWIFSRNDVIANTGVIIGGTIVYITESRWPDLIIGTVIAIIVLFGAWQIFREAHSEMKIYKKRLLKRQG